MTSERMYSKAEVGEILELSLAYGGWGADMPTATKGDCERAVSLRTRMQKYPEFFTRELGILTATIGDLEERLPMHVLMQKT